MALALTMLALIIGAFICFACIGWACPEPSPGHTPTFHFHVLGLVPRDRRRPIMLEVTMDTASKARIRIVPTSKSGKPAPVETGSIAVVAVDGSGAAVNATATIESVDTFTVQADLPDGSLVADVDFNVSADADPGSGVTTISDVVRCHITSEQAANLNPTTVEIVAR